MTRNWRVWLSGASSGLGEAMARELARRGARLALFARRRERLERLRDELVDEAGGILVQEGDVRDRERVLAAVRDAEAEWGGIDVAILNAGIGDLLRLDRFDSHLVERIFAVNVLGAVYGIEAVLPGMVARGHGHIVGISSIAAVRGLPMAAPYCASKAALTTFLESLRLELGPRGIRVTTVSPGFVHTPMTDRNRFPMPFLQPADRAARIILRGVAKGKAHVHFPKRLTLPMYFLRLLPTSLYDVVARRLLMREGYDKTPQERGPQKPPTDCAGTPPPSTGH